MTVTAAKRPFLLTFHSGHSFPLTSEDAQRLLDAYPAVSASPNRVVLAGHHESSTARGSVLRPATLGGGPAFTVTP